MLFCSRNLVVGERMILRLTAVLLLYEFHCTAQLQDVSYEQFETTAPTVVAHPVTKSREKEVYDEAEPLKLVAVTNAQATVSWTMPPEARRKMRTQRALIYQTVANAPRDGEMLETTVRHHTFKRLHGNTTYRASIEAFDERERSVFYASIILHTSLAALDDLAAPKELAIVGKSTQSLEIAWSPELTAKRSDVKQHFVNVYEWIPHINSYVKKYSYNVQAPEHALEISPLASATVFNITVQAGTTNGYGMLAWIVTSTLSAGDDVELTVKEVTPNSMTVAWPAQWLSNAIDTKCTIRARPIRAEEGVPQTEFVHKSPPDYIGKDAQFVLRNLRPGTSYNVSVTVMTQETSASGKKVAPPRPKTVWSAFSTLVHGEYVVSDARMVAEQESAVAFTWTALQSLGDVVYQLRYTVPVSEKLDLLQMLSETDKTVLLEELTEDQLRCPKFGCQRLCWMVYNLPKKPRSLNFEIRVRVDGEWNKWVRVHYTKQLSRASDPECVVVPPVDVVPHVGELHYQREIDVGSGLQELGGSTSSDIWRYLVVVDTRPHRAISNYDVPQLTDKVTANQTMMGYYITAALTPEQVKDNMPFTIGDGYIYGGYTNYPITDRNDVRWSLVPLTHADNDKFEPHLRTCGFNEKGGFTCTLSWEEMFHQLPVWAKLLIFCLLIMAVAPILVCLYCLLFKFRKIKTINEEANLMYYNEEGPETGVTYEYRRKQQRGFEPNETDERIEFMTSQ